MIQNNNLYVYAPIVLFVYNRPNHTKKVLEALLANELAHQSEIFIYSDAPKSQNDEINVVEVRKYIKKISGFKNITIIEREKNFGLANSIIDGVGKVINEYGKTIVLEDDIITSPNFLQFMNNALDFYSDNKSIMSISGYMYPCEIPYSYKKDILLFNRFSSWGWGMWSNRWNLINFDITENDKIFHDKNLQKQFNVGGEDLYNMLLLQLQGKINSWAIRTALASALHNKVTVYPIKSLVKNIGFDNSGVHCGETHVYDIVLDSMFLPEVSNVSIDDNIVKIIRKKFSPTKLQKIKSFIRKIIK
ncbi:glycosyltransferase [Campylobacter concisus]|uniref:Glycosyltransferase, family 2 n=3 Tax=Campylobacter concisus TaxID=199 RepID=A0A0M4ST05_9BACT|nr:glycosyltransferase [Campylobacter concisus]ALF46854.1 glycosyltransferase, family 2 [Campylobacter concisus]